MSLLLRATFESAGPDAGVWNLARFHSSEEKAYVPRIYGNGGIRNFVEDNNIVIEKEFRYLYSVQRTYLNNIINYSKEEIVRNTKHLVTKFFTFRPEK